MRVPSALHHLLSLLNPMRWAANTFRQEGQTQRMSRPVFRRITAAAVLLAVWALLIDIAPYELSVQAELSLDTGPVGTPTPNTAPTGNAFVLDTNSPNIIGGSEADIKDYPWRSTLLASDVHLVEIDLLRGGERAGSEVQGPPLNAADYILLVNRGVAVNPGDWPDIWPVTLDHPLPLLPIPLDPPDADVLLDMNAVLRTVYERAAYARRIDYRPPVPPPALRPVMAKWVKAHLATASSPE